MSDGSEGAGTVPNPYRAAVVAARADSVGPAGRLETALGDARRAMEGGAWVGGTADAFAADLSGWTTSVRRAGPAALATFDDALAGMPERVDPDSWYVRWQRMGPL